MKEEKKKRKRKAKKKKQNFTLYVTGLPKDVTDEEFIKFCTTAGVIAKDPVTRLPKIKIYKDDQGVPKGDAIVSFLKAPSIDNAFKLLDGFDFRPPENHVVKLELAKFENKPFKPKPKTAPLSKKQKRYNQEEAELGWEDKEQRHVIIKHMFDPRVAEKDFSFYENLEKEIAVEFARIGQVDALKIFERNEEGVVAVKYKYEYDAEKCIEIMNGRWFDGRQLSAAFYDGYSNYFVAETDEQKEEREKQWDKWLVGNDEFNDREGKQTGPTTTEIEEREIPDKMGQ
uniref:RRM domain-containing protein n=1 Tax=Arcella intermedia TaxID=1963864 RepID=A0A6B2LD64_9EUKA